MKTLVILNNTYFIITVVKGTSVAAFQSGYICKANGVISSVYDTPSGNNFLDMSFPNDHSNSIINKFWFCFNESLKANKKGSDGKRRILSIIADDFSYEKIKSNLLVAPITIFDARKYARLNSLGAKQIEKPIRIVAKLSQEKLK
ncbi:hypothetical protein GLOIN_2v1884984 [Rhizophagus clarus]|uniref:Uncharacterized protein n=1 Tax=Rhizophagus clarus TaxID=94130 RepID=A0A8H3LK85_9GLOM|nr:hypothetical protein GLOIN_2v1884984 [Rhizophagus clarus]